MRFYLKRTALKVILQASKLNFSASILFYKYVTLFAGKEEKKTFKTIFMTSYNSIQIILNFQHKAVVMIIVVPIYNLDGAYRSECKIIMARLHMPTKQIFKVAQISNKSKIINSNE